MSRFTKCTVIIFNKISHQPVGTLSCTSHIHITAVPHTLFHIHADDIIEKISSSIPNEGELLEQKLRLTLIGAKTQEQGEDSYDFLEVIRELMGLSDDAELRDMTTQKLNVAELEADYTLKGVFYRLLKEDLSSADKETNARANYALNLGICALDGGNPWDINE